MLALEGENPSLLGIQGPCTAQNWEFWVVQGLNNSVFWAAGGSNAQVMEVGMRLSCCFFVGFALL